MKTLVVCLLFAAVSFRTFAAPDLKEEEEPAPQTEVEELPALSPEVHSQLCLPGWEYFRGSCYYLNNNYNTWKDAVSFCLNYEATLAAVHSPLQYNHLQHMAGSAGHSSAWTGGYHFEGSWRWQDGSYFDYYNFGSSSSGASLKCIRMNTQMYQGWFGSSCSNVAPSICEIKANC